MRKGALAHMVDVALQPCSVRKVAGLLMIEGMGELIWACPLCFKRIAVQNIQTQGVVVMAAPFSGSKVRD